MESERFDQVTRVLGKELNRRRAIGVLGVLLGSARASLPLQQEIWAKPGKKDKGRGQGKDRNKNKNNNKNRNRNKQQTTNQAEPCWRAGGCIPKKGANVSRCDLAGSTAFQSLNCTGCNISRANLRGADLSGANLTRANLSGSCLVDANLSGAIIANNTNMYGAVICRTTMPDGSVSDAGCGLGTECCPVCDTTHPCPTGQLCCGRCVTGTCCTNAQCANPTPICVSNTCQACTSSDQCGAGKACSNGSCVPCLSPDPTSPDGTQGLQTAINNAPVGGTLYLCAGTWVAPAQIRIQKDLSLVGAGADQTIVTANDVARSGGVLAVGRSDLANVNAMLQNLTVTGGNSQNGYGGGIGCVHSTLTLESVTVTGNRSRPGGAGIWNGACNVTIIDSQVTHNTASPGGAGGIYNSGSTLKLINTDVTNNSSSASGGGISQDGVATATVDKDSSISDNTASQGGGIYAGSGTVTLDTGATMVNNTPDDCAGAGTFNDPGGACAAP